MTNSLFALDQSGLQDTGLSVLVLERTWVKGEELVALGGSLLIEKMKMIISQPPFQLDVAM